MIAFSRISFVFLFVLAFLSACNNGAVDSTSVDVDILPESSSFELPEEVTFSSHIVHIMHNSCAPCHRENGPAPFPLIDFSDIGRRSRMIAEVTSSGFMPPWPADPTYQSYVDEKILSEYEIALIRKWADEGAPAGDLASLPAPPKFPDGSVLGIPDLVVKFPKVEIKGNNKDNFLLVKVPFELPFDTFIRAIEFVPGNTRLVHHMNANLVNYEPEKKKNVFTGKPFVDVESLDNMQDGLNKLELANDDGSYPMLTPMVSNYLPGVSPSIYPNGIGGFRMSRKGAFFVNDLHYGPSASDETDESYFNIFFAPEPPKRPVSEFIMGTIGISKVEPPLVIPPDTIMSFSTRYTLPQDISVLTVNPHMHLLGKSFLAYAVTPVKDTIPLVRINNWDFRWQYFYTFKKMLKLPAGTTIYAFATFDNTSNNPHNPHVPPQTVSERNGSMRTTDEMFQFFITYVPYRPGDEFISLEK